jgi:type II secretory pathway pseudopilin PulG
MYLALLIGVAVMGIGLAAVGMVWDTAVQRERERELLFVGGQIREAIGRYYEASPGVKQYPHQLEDLLDDKRFPSIKRHLRKIYVDPMTGKPDWGLLVQGDQILGVYSQSKSKPLKVANFKLADAVFADTNAYSDWRFVYTPAGAPSAGGAALSADMQAARANAPTFAQPGAMPGGMAVPPSNSQGLPGGAPATDTWACAAARASDLRECSTSAGAKGREECERVATQQYNACVGAAAGSAQPFGNR